VRTKTGFDPRGSDFLILADQTMRTKKGVLDPKMESRELFVVFPILLP
jgi:hypothetical protein